MKYQIFETSVPLLLSYEILALNFKKNIDIREHNHKQIENQDAQVNYDNYDQTFSLLIINASIIEGTLRSILSEKINAESQSIIKERMGLGHQSPSKAEMMLDKFRYEVELQGGWENLKNQYSLFLQISLDKITDEDTREAINTLFILRNILAHGTALIQPSSLMLEEMKNIYPYNWQSKIQRASMHLNKTFNKNDIFKNLADDRVPEYFLEKTKGYFSNLETVLENDIPERAMQTINLLKKLKFGYRCNTVY